MGRYGKGEKLVCIMKSEEKEAKVLLQHTQRTATMDTRILFSSLTKIRSDIAEMQQHGVAFYGLQLGKGYNMLHNIWQL